MCLAVPMRIVSIDGGKAAVEIGGVERTIGLALTPEARVGDYVIVHAGYAIAVLDPVEARETLALFAELAALEDEPDAGGASAADGETS